MRLVFRVDRLLAHCLLEPVKLVVDSARQAGHLTCQPIESAGQLVRCQLSRAFAEGAQTRLAALPGNPAGIAYRTVNFLVVLVAHPSHLPPHRRSRTGWSWGDSGSEAHPGWRGKALDWGQWSRCASELPTTPHRAAILGHLVSRERLDELALAVATLKPDRLHINWLEGLGVRR